MTIGGVGGPWQPATLRCRHYTSKCAFKVHDFSLTHFPSRTRMDVVRTGVEISVVFRCERCGFGGAKGNQATVVDWPVLRWLPFTPRSSGTTGGVEDERGRSMCRIWPGKVPPCPGFFGTPGSRRTAVTHGGPVCPAAGVPRRMNSWRVKVKVCKSC